MLHVGVVHAHVCTHATILLAHIYSVSPPTLLCWVGCSNMCASKCVATTHPISTPSSSFPSSLPPNPPWPFPVLSLAGSSPAHDRDRRLIAEGRVVCMSLNGGGGWGVGGSSVSIIRIKVLSWLPRSLSSPA